VSPPRSRREAGQGVVEFAYLVPLFLLLLMSLLEFGIAFNHALTLSYATREGARTGAALVNGGGPLGCAAGKSPNAATVDPQIVAAVQRVLRSTGSPLKLSDIGQIRIYKSNSSGNEAGPVNVWTYTPGSGPLVDGARLDFSQASASWQACSRLNTDPPESVGISLTYTYRLFTPLGNVMGFFGGGHAPTIGMTDRTIMNLNPTEQ
jgi:hypothetical protein